MLKILKLRRVFFQFFDACLANSVYKKYHFKVKNFKILPIESVNQKALRDRFEFQPKKPNPAAWKTHLESFAGRNTESFSLKHLKFKITGFKLASVFGDVKSH